MGSAGVTVHRITAGLVTHRTHTVEAGGERHRLLLQFLSAALNSRIRSQDMINIIREHQRYFSDFGWLKTYWLFSFSHYYDPEINQTYQDMANHYDVAVVPTRCRAPKDKSKAEVGVKGIEQYILARLRNHKFFNVAEINAAIK